VELKDFVSSALLSVIEGVADAQFKSKGTGAIINPYGFHNLSKLERGEETGHLSNFDFEVAITAKKEKSASGEFSGKAGTVARIFVIDAELNGELSGSVSAESVNRLRFSVPVHLPPGNVLD